MSCFPASHSRGGSLNRHRQHPILNGLAHKTLKIAKFHPSAGLCKLDRYDAVISFSVSRKWRVYAARSGMEDGTVNSPAKSLRKLLGSPGVHMGPACFDALSAKLVERAGFDFCFTTGFGISATRLGLPDTGFISYGEMIDQGQQITGAVSIPVIGDGDNGYGNPMNVKRTVRGYIKAGFAGIILEDQVSPKSCGHTQGRKVVSREEAVLRIKAAVDARKESGSDIVIVARTDSRQAVSLEESLWRARTLADVGADVLFIDALASKEEMKAFCKVSPLVPKMLLAHHPIKSSMEFTWWNIKPTNGISYSTIRILPQGVLLHQCIELSEFNLCAIVISAGINVHLTKYIINLNFIKANMLEGGGKTPILSPMELAEVGYKLVAYPLSLLGVSIRAMQDALVAIKGGRMPSPGSMLSFEELKEILGFNIYYQEEVKYITKNIRPQLEQGYISQNSSSYSIQRSDRINTEMRNQNEQDPLVEVVTPEIYNNYIADGSSRDPPFNIWSRKLRVKITGRDGFERLDVRIPAGFLEGITNIVPALGGINIKALLDDATIEDGGKQLLDFKDTMGDRIQVFLE